MASAAGAPPGGVSGASGPHLLQFRVMRLARPTLDVDPSALRFAPEDLGAPASAASAPGAAATAPAAFERRLDLRRASDASGVTPMLLLPQAFGEIYLGETLSCYVSVGNHSRATARDVGIKCELHTERQRVVLRDDTARPIARLQPGESRDFVVEHDLKELGAHTLVCSAVYTDGGEPGLGGGERRFAPQYFKFSAGNPLAVRTKVRAGAPNRTLLEACVENATKHPLFLSEARFDAVPGLVCERVDPPTTSNRGGVLGDASLDPGAAGVGLPSAVGALAQRELAPEGGSAHFLFELRKDANEPGAAGEALGKLEIRWRGPGGETGRLQTQQIAGPNRAESEVEVRLAPDAPELRATLATPLTLRFEARNRTAAPTNALELVATDDFDLGDPRRSLSLSSGDHARGRGGGRDAAAGAIGMAVDGARSIPLGVIPPGGAVVAEVTCVPLLPGARALPTAVCRETGTGRVVGASRAIEVLVEREAAALKGGGGA